MSRYLWPATVVAILLHASATSYAEAQDNKGPPPKSQALLTIVANKDGADVVLDGRNVGKTPLDDPIPVSEGEHAVVVGAGGAARAVVFGLLWSGINEVTVLNRTLERAQALVSDLGSQPGFAPRLRALALTPKTLVESTRAAMLLVNATTVGMWPHVDGSIWPVNVPIPAQLTVFDLVYNPPETQLLRLARESGAQGIGGLGMLVKQGALSFEMWTGELAPIEVMRAACEQALRR